MLLYHVGLLDKNANKGRSFCIHFRGRHVCTLVMTCLNTAHKFWFLIFYVPIEGLKTPEN
jgi:hypothetical protein